MESSKRLVFLCLGIATTGIAIVGIFLPLLPTTPFLLLSAYFFSKSSKKLHKWLVEHRIFGELIRDWQTHKAISSKAKVLSMIVIVPLFGFTLIFNPMPVPFKIVMGLVGVAVSTFILTRPGRPKESAELS